MWGLAQPLFGHLVRGAPISAVPTMLRAHADCGLLLSESAVGHWRSSGQQAEAGRSVFLSNLTPPWAGCLDHRDEASLWDPDGGAGKKSPGTQDTGGHVKGLGAMNETELE